MTVQHPRRATEILLVEDNPGDVRLIREALKETSLGNSVQHVSDGVEAISFLTRSEPFPAAIRPDLILLDLNLPRKDGREVLKFVKKDPDLTLIPVVVLTSSRAPDDIIKSYGLHANCYVVKPTGLDQFLDMVKSIESFWLGIVMLPGILEPLPEA